METIYKILEKRLKNSLGYSEAKNKKEFEVAANVGIHITEEYYEEKIKNLENKWNSLSKTYEDICVDMKNLTNILKKYSDDEN